MKRPRVRFTDPVARLGMFILAMIAIVNETHGEDKTILRWRFQKGDRLHYAVDVDSTTTTTVPIPGPASPDLKSTVSMTIESTWSVKDVADDGSAQITQALDRVRIAVKAPGGELSEDTKAGPQKGSDRSKALQELVGGTLTLHITPQGEVTEIKLSGRLSEALGGAAACGLSEDNLKETVQRIALVLPREPVAVGTKWNRRIDKPIPGFSNEIREFAYTYQGPSGEPYRGSQLINVITKLDNKTDPQGLYRMELRYKSQDGRGTIYFDNTAGHLLSMDFTQKYELGMTMLGRESVSAHEEHIKVRLRRDNNP